MAARELIFALILLAAAALVVTGLALWQPPVAFGAAGLLLAAWGWLLLGDDGPLARDAEAP